MNDALWNDILLLHTTMLAVVEFAQSLISLKISDPVTLSLVNDSLLMRIRLGLR